MPDLRFEADKAKNEALYWEDRARELRDRLERAENMAADWRHKEKIYLDSAKALDARPFPEKVRKALEAMS